MTTAEKLELALAVDRHVKEHSKILTFYPDAGPLRRELYPKHLEFFALGREYRNRMMMASNRSGKSTVGCFETVLHATGRYKEYAPWWEGKRFGGPISCIVAGDTNLTTRDILQVKLFGRLTRKLGDPLSEALGLGTGMMPKDAIIRATPRRGAEDAYEQVTIKHVSGGTSVIKLRSFEQGEEAFQGTEEHLVWLDENFPEGVYSECLTRLATTDGHLLSTFTPIHGLNPVIKQFMDTARRGDGRHRAEKEAGSRALVTADWSSVPHLSEQAKADLLASYLPHEIEARSLGIPSLGHGAVYPLAQSDYVCDSFPIPEHYPRAFGFDVGWNWNAVVWSCWDRESDTQYIYGEYIRGQVPPDVHVAAIKARGDWLSGAIDPASSASSQADGRSLFGIYTGLGLKLYMAENGVEAGVTQVYQRLAAGKLKIFRNCVKLLEDMRLYHRDERGVIVKQKEYGHLNDALRYVTMSGPRIARVRPGTRRPGEGDDFQWSSSSFGGGKPWCWG